MKAPLLLFVALLAAPAYLLLDHWQLVPVSVRDRPWPFLLVAVLLPLWALRTAPRLRTLSLILALSSVGALAFAAHARYKLPPSSAGTGVGAPLPPLQLPDESGHLVALDAHVTTLLVWFRGSWCPYCRRQLSELAAEAGRFPEVRLLAVSPDPPEPLKKLKTDLALPFTLLSDPDRTLVNRCELSHCVAIVDAQGIVRWQVLSGNWEKDLPARALLQAAWRVR